MRNLVIPAPYNVIYFLKDTQYVPDDGAAGSLEEQRKLLSDMQCRYIGSLHALSFSCTQGVAEWRVVRKA